MTILLIADQCLNGKVDCNSNPYQLALVLRYSTHLFCLHSGITRWAAICRIALELRVREVGPENLANCYHGGNPH